MSTAERDDFLLRFNNYKVSKEKSERRHLVEDVVLTLVKTLVKQLEMKLSTLENQKILLEKTDGELMINNGEHDKVVGKSVLKLSENATTSYLGKQCA